ncbi:MAG: anaerobic ribonucleoside-triphosphate reductase activating protein [Clostridia bacterium]|nr:anaerobic ribonucleoside-triphosphate reductase activating protein [Clostridia bacterium]
MVFNGFQKTTLLDFPGKVACTVFTHGCNLLCPFCHNALLVNRGEDLPTFDETEILAYLQKRKGIIDGICISGGEPLLHQELEAFLQKVKALGVSVKLDTNGTLPDRLIHLIEAGLVDYVAMDIKNSKKKYALTAGIASLDMEKIEKSIAYLIKGSIPYEFRTTVVRELHTLEDIKGISRMIEGAENYYLQNFVDSGLLIGENLSPHSPDTLSLFCDEAKKVLKNVKIRGI